MEFLRQFLASVRETWGQLSTSARINIALAGALTFGVLLVLLIVGARENYVTLYSDLSPEDAAAVQEYLTTNNVPYREEAGGTTILVPVQRLSDVRVELMAQNLVTQQGRVPGFEIFDRQDFTASQRLQEINYQRALQGELQTMLNQLDFVRSSVVFIYHAPEQLFEESQEPSEAAVTLELTRQPTPREVDALVSLIATFGGGLLSADTITVVSTDGETLHQPPGDTLVAQAGTKMEYITQLERAREEKVLEALRRSGYEAVVRVSANVAFDESTETLQEVLEGEPVSTYEETTELTTRDAPPEGPPGFAENPPEGIAPPGAILTEETTESTLSNFETGLRTTETRREFGEPERFAVSVLMDGEYEAVLGEDGEPTGDMEFVGLPEAEVEEWRQVIAKIVGTDVQPDQDVVIKVHPFQTARLADAQDVLREMEARETWQMWQNVLTTALWLVLIVAGLLAFRFFLLRALVQPEVVEEEEAVEAPAPTPEEQRMRDIAAEVERISQEDPAMVASLLRTWMSEAEE